MSADTWDDSLLIDPHFTYRAQRNAWRDKSWREVLQPDSPAEEVVALTEDMLAGIALGLSGISWEHVPRARYTSDLVVSFIRTHFIAMDLVLASELIEASTLLRKQLELMARLRELSSAIDDERLLRRTPNLRHLRSQVRGLYGPYSAIAHSSDPQHLELLGSGGEPNGGFRSLYPKYGVNTLIALHNLAHVALEFTVWVFEFFPANDLPLRDPKLGGMANRVAARLQDLVPE